MLGYGGPTSAPHTIQHPFPAAAEGRPRRRGQAAGHSDHGHLPAGRAEGDHLLAAPHCQ